MSEPQKTYRMIKKNLFEYKKHFNEMIKNENEFLFSQNASDRDYTILKALKETLKKIDTLLYDITLVLHRYDEAYTSHPETVKIYLNKFNMVLC